MPAINDLTPEEEQAFIEHGVQPAGPGSEPVIENEGDVQQRGEPVSPHGDRQPEPTITVERDPATGRFVPKDIATGAPLAPAPADPNAPPAPAAPGAPPAPPQTVPLAALHEARQQTQQARQQMQILQTRMNTILASRAAEVQAPQMPDMAQDPVGYMRAMEERIATFEAERAEETFNRQIETGLEQEEAIFSQQVPDYEQASHHYVQSRAAELLAFHDAPAAQKILQDEARQIAQQAWQRGIPAPQMIYQLAQARGYRPGAPAQPAPAPQPPQAPAYPQPVLTQPGYQPAYAPAPAPQPRGPAPAAVIASVQAGQAASRSLSGAGGSASPTQLNAEAILAMSDEEFEAALGLGGKGANARFSAIAGQ